MPSKKTATPKPASVRGTRGRTSEGALFTAAPSKLSLPAGYASTLQDIKAHLRSARVRAVLAANPIVIEAYWHTGKIILQRQSESAWGAKVIDRLAADLREEFPDMRGLSARNLLAMKIFAREFPNGPITQQPVAQLPWGHVLQIMQRLKSPAARDFYIRQAAAHGWSRSILEIQIQGQPHLRTGKAVNNFALTMPPAESDMAAQLFKDPYLFDFIGTADPRREAEVEQALMDHVQRFLLELGAGFAFVAARPVRFLEFSFRISRTTADAGQPSETDTLLANPPFNGSVRFRKEDDPAMSDWHGAAAEMEQPQVDQQGAAQQRRQFGVPHNGNANFAWVQYFIHHLAPQGMAGFVLANGPAVAESSNQSGDPKHPLKLAA
jgi:predicted nuclease of restriction endonuclease-like (RecB) superfamily